MTPDDLETLVRLHQNELFRYLRYLGAAHAAAEDLVQETFLVAFRSDTLPTIENDRARAAWLRTTARHRFLHYCREKRRGARPTGEAMLEDAEAVWNADFLRGGDGFDTVEALRKCLDALSTDQRRAVDLQYAQRASRADMAGLLKMTEDGVKSLMRRIRAKLADCIERRLHVETSR